MCIPEMVTTFLVLFNMGNYKKTPFKEVDKQYRGGQAL